MARWVLIVGVGPLIAAPAAAQLPDPGPPGPYVVDVRAVTGGFPRDPGFFPPVPPATIVPSRGAGIDVGAHVYLVRVGPSRVGLGLNVLRVSHTTSPASPPASSPPAPAAPRTMPDVEAIFTTLAPQVSFNFGTADGWSYLSAGFGTAQLQTATSGLALQAARNSARLSAVNAGGGARWFMRRHVALSFDVRFHVIGAGERPVPQPSTPRAVLISASGGLSLR